MHANTVIAKDTAISETVRQLREYVSALEDEKQRMLGLIAALDDHMSERSPIGSYVSETQSQDNDGDGLEEAIRKEFDQQREAA